MWRWVRVTVMEFFCRSQYSASLFSFVIDSASFFVFTVLMYPFLTLFIVRTSCVSVDVSAML